MSSTIKVIEQPIYVYVPDSDDTLTITQVTDGLMLGAEIVAALNAAAAPSATNAFATLADVTAASAADLAAHVAATDPHGDRAFASGLAANYDAAGAASTAVANHVIAADPHGDRDYAAGLVGLKLPIDVPVSANGLPAWAVPFSLNDVLGDLFGTLIPWSNASKVKFVFNYGHDGFIDTAIWTIDPFGSARWYQPFVAAPNTGTTIQLVAVLAGEVLTQYELQYFHIEADDPHGDRANTTSQIGAHAADSGAHRNYARIFMMGV